MFPHRWIADRNNLNEELLRFVLANEMRCNVLWVLILVGCFVESNGPVVIAHRGASGYAVEHTEAAKAMAHAQGADYRTRRRS